MEIEAASPRRPPSWLARASSLLPTSRPANPFRRLASADGDDGNAAAPPPPPPDAATASTSDGDCAAVVGVSPEDEAGPVGRLFFSYVSPLVKLGVSKPLDAADLWPVSARDGAARVSASFRGALVGSATEARPAGRLASALARAYGRPFVVAGVIKLFHDAALFLSPVILRRLLRTGPAGDRWAAAGLAAALAAAGVAECLSVNVYFHILFRISLHSRAALVDALYAKALRVSAAARDARGSGAVANLMSNDAAKIWALPSYIHMLWSAPLQIAVVMAMLVSVLGPVPAAVALGVTLAIVPASTAVGRRLAALRRGVIAKTDARVKLAAEVVGGIRAVKLGAWEGPYVDRITALRNEELRAIRHAAFVGIFNQLVFQGAPIVVSAASLSAFVLSGRPLTADVAFTAITLFNLLRFPVMMLPSQITALIQGRVAVDRIQSFLEEEEVAPPPPAPAASPPSPAVEVVGGAFAFRAGEAPFLRVPALRLPAGALVVVVGRIGAGKTSLLAALLGEMAAVAGTVRVAGRVAYAPQEAWVRNASLRENIVFDAPFRPVWYAAVLAACQLERDVADMPAGDETIVGNKGLTLSGGQRARAGLARAVYSDADVVLLDDPLAAVDAHVGAALWRDCVKGVLAGRTRVVVTHHAPLAADADVVVVMRDGAVVEVGAPGDLAARGVDLGGAVEAAPAGAAADAPPPPAPRPPSGPPAPPTPGADTPSPPTSSASSPPKPPASVFGGGQGATNGAEAEAGAEDALLDVPLTAGAPPSSSSAPPAPAATLASTRASARIVKAEARAVGRVQASVYKTYLAAWGSLGAVAGVAVPLPAAILATATVERSLATGQTVFLAHWTDATAAGAAPAAAGALAAYVSMGAASLALSAARAAATVVGSTAAAAALHARLLATVVRLPMSFFDAQPAGRLLNRFSRDTEALDVVLGETVQSVLTCFSSTVFSVLVALAATPAVAGLLIPLAFVFWRVQTAYIAASREIKRLDSVALSPVFGAFSETLAGLTTLRAFRAAGPACARQARLLDASTRAMWPMRVLDRWLSVRLELLANGVVGAVALVFAVAPPSTAGVAGLALTSALQLTGLLNWAVRKATELEVNITSVERVVDTETEPTEAPAVVPGHRPPPGWPTTGAVAVEGLVVRYRADLDPVLRGVSFTVAPGAKVGIVGRTGSGKSTLCAALFRIVEPVAGRVVIDGVDTASLGLADLRRALGLVPQDPVLFSGTIRSNLDPLGAHPDPALWTALDRAALGGAVRAMPHGLDAKVGEAGAGLSAGERQLLAVARALLRTPRVLLLDEATSSVDGATDAAIQAAIRTHFKDATVLTIAHRLHTVADSDVVVVMDGGVVAEWGPPAALLADAGGAFRGLVDEAARGRARGVGRAASAAELLAGVGGGG